MTKAVKELPIAVSHTVESNIVREISLEQLEASRNNPRRTMNEADLAELAASIREHGVNVPLLVRPADRSVVVELEDGTVFDFPAMSREEARPYILGTAPEFEGKKIRSCEVSDLYEIVCGHRRSEAATLAGLTSVPCIVRVMDDATAAELALIDNLQRVDVPALEEAEAFVALRERLGTVEAVAARVGKDVKHVARRLQLVSLAEMPRKALQERLITVDHALLLARLGVDEQDVILKWALDVSAGVKMPVEKVIEGLIKNGKSDRRWKWEAQSPQRMKERIEQHAGRKLSRAPWDLADGNLVKDAPACNACPSNTAHNDTLFGDLNIEAATCENGGCFESKRTAFVQIRLSEATVKQEAGRGPAARLSWKETTVKPRFSEAKAGSVMVDESGINLLQVFKVGQWVEAKPKSCVHVRLGVTVDWSDDANRGYMGSGEKLRKPGQQLTVCIAPGCKAHRKEWEKPKSENRNAPYDAKAEEEKHEKMRLAALAETRLRVRLASEAIGRVKSLHLDMLREILIDQIPTGRQREAFNAILPGIETILRTAKIDSAEFARAVALLSVARDHIEVWQYHEANNNRKEFIASMKRLGYDASKAWEKPSEPKAEKKAAEKKSPAKKSVLTAAARKRIADAQKKRWAAPKKAGRK